MNYFKLILDTEIVGVLKSGGFPLKHLIDINFS